MSSGGIENIDDSGKLHIDTRSLNRLLSEDSCPCKILIMHHYVSWLSKWGQDCFNTIVVSQFSASLTGHIHQQDALIYKKNSESQFIECCAPQLFSDKKDDLGYAIIKIEDDGTIMSISYREWSYKHSKFLCGVNLAGNDDGKIICDIGKSEDYKVSKDIRVNIFETRLSNAMRAYSDYPPIWLNRRLSKTRNSYIKFQTNPEDEVYISDIVQLPHSMYIISPPEFGLTCLSHYMVLQAWKNYSNFWLRIDLNEIRLKDVERHIDSEMNLFSFDISDVKCLIIDSWTTTTKENIKIIDKLRNRISNTPLIIMQTVEPNQIISDNLISDELDGIKERIHLLPLKRNDIRPMWSFGNIDEDEDILVSRITSDLEMLNMHWTPLNCYTLLTASHEDTSTIVNRTTLIERVLAILFGNDELPQYLTSPDVKDCEHVLGCFCEDLIRSETYFFSREKFNNFIRATCEKDYLDIDIECLFNILYNNSIIIKSNENFKFKHSFSIYYFSAKRMIADSEFATYILSNKKYIDFPEIIEFYTGVDRRRDDALKVLIDDIQQSCKKVRDKIGMPLSMIPYESLKWKPNSQILDKVKKDFSEDVQSSKLPKEIKDKHADACYNPAKPFDQDIHTILSDYYVLILMRDIRAASMALRNSDYSNGDLKNQLLSNITESWEQVAQVIVALSPILATQGIAGCGGASFVLSGNFGDDMDEKIKNIILRIPENIIRWFQNDIISQKLGPLFFKHVDHNDNKFRQHLVALILVHDRPKGWKDKILAYIASLHKNSYYLYDLFCGLNTEYTFSYAIDSELRDIGYLIKACVAKHDTGVKIPGTDAVRKVSNDILPDKCLMDE